MGKSYAVRMRQFMETHKISRNLLASMTQVNPNHIARLETGEISPSEEWWNKFELLEQNLRRKEMVRF